ncbi:MAG: sigma 54-interacting transcriptional regulator [Deltaproteobacteria bacterium]|nr:sigma 54-interacting transcriptional regulator [Deltaproteobacteria bacterium]
MPVLSWAAAPDRPRRYAIYKKLTTLGAAPDNDVVLEGPGIVPYHAVVMFDGRDFNLREVSREGEIAQNGRKRRQFRLHHSDRVGLGDVTIDFSAYDEYAGQPCAGAPSPGEDRLIQGLTRLHDFSKALMGKSAVEELLPALLDSVVALTQADKGFLLMFEDGKPVVRGSRNLGPGDSPLIAAGGDPARLVSDSILKQVVERREPVLVADALHDSAFSTAQSVIDLKLCSVMVVPLLEEGNLLGVLYLGNDRVANLFDENHLRILTVFAAQASLILQKARLVERFRQDRDKYKQQVEVQTFGDLVGSSPAMLDVFARVRKVAPTDVSVMILGETGTGKELIAREIHRRSNRTKGPFVAINCGAIPETLMESELFGHVRGAFTGAVATHLGKFQAAAGGTIFLDEVGELPLSLQVKLLRVLQDRVVVKVGDTRPEKIDVRVLAATNKLLEEEVRTGRFREDLYYRLNVVTIGLPPLRERGEDIVTIANYFLKKHREELSTTVAGFAPEALAAIRRFEWPGNVRQLENRIKKAMVMCEGTLLGATDLDLAAQDLAPVVPLAQAKEDFQRRYVLEVLERNGGNRTQTAKDLGVDPRTIFRYLEKEDAEERSGQV